MGEAVALHGGKQFGAVVDMVAVAGNQAVRFGKYFEGGGVAAAQFAVGAGAAELDGVALDAPAVFGFVELGEGKPGHGCLLESVWGNIGSLCRNSASNAPKHRFGQLFGVAVSGIYSQTVCLRGYLKTDKAWDEAT